MEITCLGLRSRLLASVWQMNLKKYGDQLCHTLSPEEHCFISGIYTLALLLSGFRA